MFDVEILKQYLIQYSKVVIDETGKLHIAFLKTLLKALDWYVDGKTDADGYAELETFVISLFPNL